MQGDIPFSSATELAGAIRDGRLSSVEATQAILDRIDLLDAKVGAFVTVVREAALADAAAADARRARKETLGPLHGVPVSIKDIIYTRGVRTTGGSFLFENFVPTDDAIVVTRLKASGAVVIGKTTTPEFCHKTVTDSPLLGTTRNPHDLGRTPGGSSGGSAAAVAAGFGPVSIGTDGGGSIRLPASLCGVAGFKPTFGRVPQYPGFEGWDFLGHTGPLARSVADIGLTMAAISGPDARDPASLARADVPIRNGALRIAAVSSLNHLVPEPEVAQALTLAVDGARALGHTVREAQVSWIDPDLQFRIIIATDIARALARYLPDQAERMDPTLVKIVEFGAARSAVELVGAFAWQRALCREIMGFFEDVDLVLVPTAPVTAFPLGILGPTTISGRKVSPYDWFAWTWPFNVTGQPALSMPVWTSGSLPAGIQIVGRPGADALVIDFATKLERALGQPVRRPAL